MTTADVTTVRPLVPVQRLSWLRSTHAEFLLSQRVYWRDIGFALTGVLLPLALSIAYPLSQRGEAPVAGFDPGVYLLPGFMGFVLLWIIYNVINSAASRRGRLIYKRLRGTSMPGSAILTGEALSGSVTSLAQVVVLAVLGVTVFGRGPSNVPLLVLGVVLGALAFSLISIGISGLLPSGEVSTWIVTPFIFLMMLASGIVVPLSSLPEAVQEIARFLPSSPVVDILRTAWLGRDFATDPGTLTPSAVGILGGFRACLEPIGLLCGWIGLAIGLGKRFFRWDPRRSA